MKWKKWPEYKPGIEEEYLCLFANADLENDDNVSFEYKLVPWNGKSWNKHEARYPMVFWTELPTAPGCK